MSQNILIDVIKLFEENLDLLQNWNSNSMTWSSGYGRRLMIEGSLVQIQALETRWINQWIIK